MSRSGWGKERERKGESEKEIAGSSGVRRGVWHPLSCLLKASFFPSLPPLHVADRRYFQRLHSAALCLLHRLLKGSQKLKPEGVDRPFRFGSQWRHTKGRIKYVCLCACFRVHSWACDARPFIEEVLNKEWWKSVRTGGRLRSLRSKMLQRRGSQTGYTSGWLILYDSFRSDFC